MTNLVQGIVAPETCGIGGDLFALIWIPGKNKPEFLDASGYSGSNVDQDLLSNYENIPLNHPLSVTVPGAVAGWKLAYDFSIQNLGGKIPMSRLLFDAEQAAKEGIAVTNALRNNLKSKLNQLVDLVGFKDVYLKNVKNTSTSFSSDFSCF